jgi:flagellar biosynthetic protein FliQ
MTPESAVQTIRDAWIVAFWLAAPLLAIGFIAGIVTSLAQIATSIQDNAVSSIPRLIAFFAGFLVLIPWMLQKAMEYAVGVLGHLASYAH